MAAASSRWRGRWRAPAARRFSSPRWMKRAPRASAAVGRDLRARRILPELRRQPSPRSNCRPVIGDLNELAEWDVFCRRSGWAGGAAIHIDTGMNRLGLTLVEAQGHRAADQCRRSRHHAGDEPPRLRRKPQSSAQRQTGRGLPRDRQPVFRRAGLAGEFLRHLSRPAIPVRHGAAGRRALRHQSDAGSRQSDAGGRRSEGAHRADPQCRARRKRRLWRNLDRAAADQTCDRLRRLCRRLFPRRQRQ